ncbi:MAG: tetratricopeptide repeat protein [Dehalococcoidia bacterium]
MSDHAAMNGRTGAGFAEMATQTTTADRNTWTGRILWQYLPIALLVTGIGFAAQQLLTPGNDTAAPAIDPAYEQRRDADIAFFEARVRETNDSLSYNRLTGLYLQRFRDTGDVSDLGRAETTAGRSLEVARGAYTGLVNLGIVKVAQHRFEDAAKLAEQAIALEANEPAGYAVLGDAQLATGQIAEATRTYQTLLDRWPGPAAFARQASLAEARGSTDVALQFWDAAIDADAKGVPENAAWAEVQRGHLLFATGNLDGAEKAFEGALRTFPGYPAALAGLGKTRAAEGDLQGAAARLRDATSRIPAPEFVIALGEVLARSGDEAGAARQFAVVGAIRDLFAANGVTDDLTLIAFAADHGDLTPSVVTAAADAYARRPGADAASTYAWVLHRAGRSQEALPLARASLANGTRDPLMHYRAGAIADAAGDPALAKASITAAWQANRAFSAWHGPDLARLAAKLGVAK